jgi:adenosylmethionine-8-amino-7-oxononanoate aminotransferase
MCLSKGITAGYMPFSLVVTTSHVYSAFYAEYKELKAFMHSHSYTGNALACAVARESLRIFAENDVLVQNERRAKIITDKVTALAQDHLHIGEYRHLGMIGALELVEDKISKKAFDWQKRIGYGIYRLALEKGVLLRPLGNVIYFMPPYIVEEDDIDLMVRVAFEAINEYFRS